MLNPALRIAFDFRRAGVESDLPRTVVQHGDVDELVVGQDLADGIIGIAQDGGALEILSDQLQATGGIQKRGWLGLRHEQVADLFPFGITPQGEGEAN